MFPEEIGENFGTGSSFCGSFGGGFAFVGGKICIGTDVRFVLVCSCSVAFNNGFEVRGVLTVFGAFSSV